MATIVRESPEHFCDIRQLTIDAFTASAIAQVFGSELAGRCKDRPDLVEIPLPLEVIIEVLPAKGGED